MFMTEPLNKLIFFIFKDIKKERHIRNVGAVWYFEGLPSFFNQNKQINTHTNL
jgi:hypothetical protein